MSRCGADLKDAKQNSQKKKRKKVGIIIHQPNTHAHSYIYTNIKLTAVLSLPALWVVTKLDTYYCRASMNVASLAILNFIWFVTGSFFKTILKNTFNRTVVDVNLLVLGVKKILAHKYINNPA